MKKMLVCLPILLIVVGVFMYFDKTNLKVINLFREKVLHPDNPIGTEPQLYLSNKAIVCYYLAYNTISGGKYKDAFDFDYINNIIMPIGDPTNSFSFKLKWDGFQIDYQILNVGSPTMAEYVKSVLTNIQRYRFKENAEFDLVVTMNYKSRTIRVDVCNFIGHSPTTDGVVKMKDVLPNDLMINRLIPFIVNKVSVNYTGRI